MTASPIFQIQFKIVMLLLPLAHLREQLKEMNEPNIKGSFVADGGAIPGKRMWVASAINGCDNPINGIAANGGFSRKCLQVRYRRLPSQHLPSYFSNC